MHGIAYFFIKIHGLGHPLQQTAEVPLRDGVSVQNDRIARPDMPRQAALRPGTFPDAGSYLHDEPLRGRVRDVELAGVVHLARKQYQLPQVQIVDTAVDGVAHAAARHRQYHLIIRVGVDHRLDILPVCIQAHDNLTVLQGGTGILLRQNGIHVMRHFLQDHERLLLLNFVFTTIISHFATFALQIRQKFCEGFVIIKAKKGTMCRLNKIYYAILYNMHIVCQITSSTIQLYAK